MREGQEELSMVESGNPGQHLGPLHERKEGLIKAHSFGLDGSL